jgi:hypothetical protein
MAASADVERAASCAELMTEAAAPMNAPTCVDRSAAS